MKEQLRQVFRLPTEQALTMLKGWIDWARRCRLQAFVKLVRTITYYWTDIEAALAQELSNARTEAMNTRIRLTARRAFGFHSAEALIALSELSLGGLCPTLRGACIVAHRYVSGPIFAPHPALFHATDQDQILTGFRDLRFRFAVIRSDTYIDTRADTALRAYASELRLPSLPSSS